MLYVPDDHPQQLLAPPAMHDDDLRFVRGVVIATAISLAMWAALAFFAIKYFI